MGRPLLFPADGLSLYPSGLPVSGSGPPQPRDVFFPLSAAGASRRTPCSETLREDRTTLKLDLEGCIIVANIDPAIDMVRAREIYGILEEIDQRIGAQDASSRTLLYQAKERMRELMVGIDRYAEKTAE